MLNRKGGGLPAATPLGFSRPSNEGLFIRRVSAVNDDSKHSTADEATSPDWGSPDALRSPGNAISWSADNLHFQTREQCGSSIAALDSPKSSYIGSPTRCTGGGHGEAGPSTSGGMRLSFIGMDSSGMAQSLLSPTRKSTPLARHLAERALQTRSTRRSIDSPSAMRSRDSAAAHPHSNSTLPNATSAPVNAISTPACSTSSTFEKLPSFLRNSTPIISSVPEPPAPSIPSPTPHPPMYPPASPSSSSVLVPWINNSNNNSMHSLNAGNVMAHNSGSSKEGSPNTTCRALTPVSPSTPPSSSRPSRHGLIGARRASTGPITSLPPGADGFLDMAIGGRVRSGASGVISASNHGGPVTLGSVVRRPTSPPPFQPRQPPNCGLVHLWAGSPGAMRRGEWTMSQFTIARQLYGGYASSVFKARCLRSSLDVVLKVYTLSSLSDFLRNQVLRELDIHARLENPGVVQLMAAFREGDKLVLVLEYVRGGSLDRARRKLGGRLSEQQALELVMVPLLRTLHYLHNKQIVHRDIKPENILFTPEWKLKVCDYGVSVCLTEERAVTRTGSRDYMAPEVQICPLKRAPDDNKTNTQLAYGASADIWSLGVLTYELLVGFTPFPGGPPPPEDKLAGGGVRQLAFPSCISVEARNFVHSCLQDVPGDRPTIFELLKHRWVQGALAS